MINEKKEKCSTRLSDAIRIKNIKQSEICRITGIPKSAMSQYISGAFEPKQDRLCLIAKALDVSEVWLMGYDVPMERTNNDKIAPSPNAIFLDDHKVYLIPLYENVSAGFGVLPISEINEYIPLYFNTPYEAKESICIKVRGDSMFPKIEDGDIIQVHKQDYVDSGAIAVMLIDGEEGVVKKIAYGDGWIELQSINPMYPPMRFEGTDTARIRVVGAVRKIIKEV